MSGSENSATVIIDKAGLAFLRDPPGNSQGDPQNTAVPIFVRLFSNALVYCLIIFQLERNLVIAGD